MENPRRLLCIRVRQNDVEITNNNHILSSVIDAIYYNSPVVKLGSLPL